MAANPLSPSNPQDPPDALVKRTAQVATTVMNTVRVPHDRFHDERARWYKKGSAQQNIIMPDYSEGNEVKYLIDGKTAFPEMVAAIRTATGPGHFIYMINWFCDIDFHLVPETNLRTLLLQARGVMIRAMFWKPPPPKHQNNGAIHFLNGVRMVKDDTAVDEQIERAVPDPNTPDNSAAIHDDRGNEPLPVLHVLPRAIGSQHQKILCVNGEQGLVCFVGGIDFNPDRISDPDGKAEVHGQPLHDVHCRIIGPAALELVNIFVEKWNDHPHSKVVAADPKKGALIKSSDLPAPLQTGDHVVQVGRTYPPRGIYSFRSQGEQSAAGLIAHAIRNAKRFIYTECQYFVGCDDLRDALLAALPNIEHFTAVITHWEVSDLPFVNAHRRKFIEALKSSPHGHKVRMFTLQPDGNNSVTFQDGHVAHTYVHAKTWVVDDEFAVISTVNSNRRSWTHDTEVAAGIYETSTDQVLRFRLAHWLRMDIWKEHLGMDPVEGPAELADGVASAVHWSRLPAGARVAHYDLNQKNQNGDNDQIIPYLGRVPIFGGSPLNIVLWNDALDPQYDSRPEAKGA